MDWTGLLLHATGPVRAEMRGAWWYRNQMIALSSHEHIATHLKYTLLKSHPSLRFHDCQLWLSVSATDRRMHLWCNCVSSFCACHCVRKLLPTLILVYLSNSWCDAWSLPALKDRTMRDHQSLTGAFQIVFSSAKRAIAEPNHFHDSLSAGRDSWPELVILRCRPQGWTGAFVGHRRQDCAGGDHFKGFELLFP